MPALETNTPCPSTLADTAERIQLVLDSAPLAVAIYDENKIMVDVNQHAMNLYGFKNKREALHEYNTHPQRFYPVTQPCGEHTLTKVMAFFAIAEAEGQANGIWEHLTITGQALPVEVDLFKLLDGEHTFFVTYVRDLRPMLAAERDAREANRLAAQAQTALDDRHQLIAKTQLVLDAAPLSVTLHNASRRMLDCNTHALNLFGFTSKAEMVEAFNTRFLDFFPEVQPNGRTTKEEMARFDQEAAEHGFIRSEFMYLSATGEELPTEFTYTKVKYLDTYLFVSFVRDLREEKLLREKEREADAFGRTLYELSPMGIDIWDEDLKLVDYNDAVLKLFGFDYREELNGDYSTVTPLYQPNGELSETYYNRYFQQAFDEGASTFELMMQDKNKEEVPLGCTYTRIVQDGKPLIVGYNYDLRELKVAEKLRIEMAEQSNRAKSQFLARVSHEIRTPISAVLGISEIELQNQDLTPHTEEAFAKIHNSAKNLLDLVNDLLDISRIEAGKMELIIQEYDTASMISDVSQMQASFLGSRRIEFDLQVDEYLPQTLIGDMLRIEQILNNLLSNAFKYTQEGRVNLSFVWDNGELVVTVQDTGIGMTARQIEALYQEFERFHEHQLRHIGGAGLGMAIVNNLVELMNGRIEIESRVDHGTTVKVHIPQKTASKEMIGKTLAQRLQKFDLFATNPSKSFKFEPVSLPNSKVLVVDDMEANLYVAKGLLKFYDLQIETCTSGYEAIEKIKRGRVYDLIFMDQMMPGIDGTETLQKLRALGYKAPVVALTANALIGQAENFIRSGFDGFISKPIETSHLNALIMKYIGSKYPASAIKSVPKQANVTIHEFQKDAKLQEKLRLDFIRNHKHVCSQLKDAMESGDVKTAHRLAHSLKGVAGLMHEPQLMDIASRVEKVLRDEENADAMLLSLLEAEHERVLRSIDLPEKQQAPLAEAVDMDKVDEVLDTLAFLLKTGNMACLTHIEELRAVPQAAVMVRLIEDFEFELALKTLETLRLVLFG